MAIFGTLKQRKAGKNIHFLTNCFFILIVRRCILDCSIARVILATRASYRRTKFSSRKRNLVYFDLLVYLLSSLFSAATLILVRVFLIDTKNLPF